MSKRAWFAPVLLFFALGLAFLQVHAGVAEHDGPGNLRTVNLAGQRLGITTEIQMPSTGWQDIANTRSFWRVSDVQYSEDAAGRTWTGRASADNGIGFTYAQTFLESPESILFRGEVRSETVWTLEGLFLMVRLPLGVFSGGSCVLSAGEAPPVRVDLPEIYPGAPHLLFSVANRVQASDAEGNFQLDITFPAAYSVTVQDNRQWGDPVYGLLFRFHAGSLPYGTKASVEASLQLTGTPDSSPFRLSLNPLGTGRRFDGWGGNYVFCTDGPEVDFTLSSLRVAWGRTQMSLRSWEPSNDNSSDEQPNWSYFEGRDQPGSDLRREFELSSELAARGIPLIVSIWYLPKWLQVMNGTAVPRSSWGELFESVTSYLLYAKTRYGVEPELFSFNEPDLGIHVLFSDEDHRDAIKELGARFEALGLKTKLLLGDTASARGTVQYLAPVLEDSEAIRHVTALAFHSWHGASTQEYEEWKTLSEALSLPLLVTEAGSDASAYYFPALFRTFGYALEDLENYMHFLGSSEPQAAMLWEYTCDYPVVFWENGNPVPTVRYWFIKHLSDLTPASSEILEVDSDRDNLLAVAYRGTTPSPDRYVLHIANLGPERQGTVIGIPSGVNLLHRVHTSEHSWYQPLPPVRVVRGRARISLGAQSLVTLTGRVESQWRWRRRIPEPAEPDEHLTLQNRGQ